MGGGKVQPSGTRHAPGDGLQTFSGHCRVTLLAFGFTVRFNSPLEPTDLGPFLCVGVGPTAFLPFRVLGLLEFGDLQLKILDNATTGSQLPSK